MTTADTTTSIASGIQESHVLAILTGAPLDRTAEQARVSPHELAEAADAYRAAGRSVLNVHDDGPWYQARITFTDWDTAEHVAADSICPYLEEARTDGHIGAWWFIRKYPCWRLRCRPGPTGNLASVETALTTILIRTGSGLVEQWWRSRYEPETYAFGGPAGIRIAHDLFHADSCGVLDYIHCTRHGQGPVGVGRREISVILIIALLRAAGMDRHERADVFTRVVHERPLDPPPPSERLQAMTGAIRTLMSIPVDETTPHLEAYGDLRFAASWANAFSTAGRLLASADYNGELTHGLRSILAKHVIFHWNRLGLSAATQAVLARAARDSLLPPEPSDPEQPG